MAGPGAIAGVLAGLVVLAAGLYMLRWGRTRHTSGSEAEAGASAGVLATLLGEVSLASRYVIGFCLLLLGYHLISYSLPAGTLWLRVPPERLWVMGALICVAVAGSLMMDVAERRSRRN
jgi:hypothetical protein